MAPAFTPLPFAFEAQSDQSQSPLFKLPPELREDIFNLCLTDCEKITKRYRRSSLWNRPGHYAPHITYTDLLRTCKRCYQEAWYMPWANREHNLFLVAKDRRPKDALNPYYLETQLQSLHAAEGDVTIGHAHIFSQLYILEACRPLQDVLNISHFLPRELTITIRHTDFWYWESDHPLLIRNRWVRDLRLPDSVVTLRMEMETLDRKKDQLNWLSVQAANSWTFTRKDGRQLKSDSSSIAHSTWVGQSMLNKERWIRDETRPGELDYYIATITWNLQRDGAQTSQDNERSPTMALEAESLEAIGHPIQCALASLDVNQLRRAKILPTTPGDAALAMYQALLDAEREERAGRIRQVDADNEMDENDDDDGGDNSEYEDDGGEDDSGAEVQDSQMTDADDSDEQHGNEEDHDNDQAEAEEEQEEDPYSDDEVDSTTQDSGTDAFGIDWTHQWRPPAINAQRFGGVHTQYAWDWIEHLRREDQRQHRRRQKEQMAEAAGDA